MKSLLDWCGENNRGDMLRCYLEGANTHSPADVGFSSGKKVQWKCPVCTLTWEASPNKMNRRHPDRIFCPYCSHERASPFYNAALLYPEMLSYWDAENNQGSLSDQLPKSGYVAHWRCGEGHTWTRSIKEQASAVERYRRNLAQKADGLCPYCSHERVSSQYNLEVLYGEVARQWYYGGNGTLTPRDVSPYSGKKVLWKCSYDPSHIWADRISNRTMLLRGCPICAKHFRISYPARALYYYLHHSGVDCACEIPVGRYSIDIEIRCKKPGMPPVALEIDGYRHRTPEAALRDARKDALLRQLGYRVIRLKEVPEQKDEIRIQNDVITYPASDRNIYLNRLIQYVMLLTAGVHMEPDHVHDHWKIEEFYYHTRRERSLAVRYPALAREWSQRNRDTPEVVSPGLSAKRWWKCPNCGKEYQATISNRTRHNSGCPYCSHLRVTAETCLAAVFPEIAQEWDLEKNAPLKPTDVLPGTDKRVWWKCRYGHSWKALIYTRTGKNRSKCPVCQRRAVGPGTSLADEAPELADYWHPFKNNRLPDKVAPHSNQKFWWRCPEGHEWQDTPNTLQKYTPDRICPYCDHRRLSTEYCLAAQNESLAALWHPSTNCCTAQEIAPHSNKKVWWQCEKGHEWQDTVSQAQVFGAQKACPYCNNRRVWAGNCLANLAPQLAAQWHPTKNGLLTPENVLARSARKVWWRCPKGHEWQTTVAKRYQRGDGCPFCSGHRASPENCLGALYPEIIHQWDSVRNAPLTPYDVTACSGKRVWWKCSEGHTWHRTVIGQIKSQGCPYCRKPVRHRSIAEEHPELIAQWDMARNDRAPDQYAAHSNKKVWWRCEFGHSWQATPDTRARGSGCPFCAQERRRKKPDDPGSGLPQK